jgi:hypothetical protein
MEYDVLEGCLDMDQSSWMTGDRVQEHMLSAGTRRHKKAQAWEAHKRGKACAFGALCREMSCNSIVQMIKCVTVCLGPIHFLYFLTIVLHHDRLLLPSLDD